MEQQTILIVDDDREIVRVIAKILELEGYRTLKAYDGLEALDMLVSNVVHLIMIDIMMPKMNGLAAVMKIRETIIFLLSFYQPRPRKQIRFWDCLWERMTISASHLIPRR